MKRAYLFIILAALCLAVVGNAEAKKHKPPKENPAYPGKAATHTLILQRVLFSDLDFSRDSTGGPRQIAVELTENGNAVMPTSGDTLLDGTRGERLLQTPIQWIVNFDPHKNYQLILTEQVPMGASVAGKRIITPATPRAGYWPFGEQVGKLSVGKSSYLQFVDKIQ